MKQKVISISFIIFIFTFSLLSFIFQDEVISKEIESVNVTGTKISKNIIIVPIDNSLLYIEQIFQQQLTTILKKKLQFQPPMTLHLFFSRRI